jgi:2'-5' RNA ligase
MVNHFLALRLADASRDRLAVVAQRLEGWGLPAAWVDPDDYHLTVAFLGQMAEEDADRLPSAIDLVAGGLRRPALWFAGLGARGGRLEPRTVFAAASDPTGACKDIHLDLCAGLDLTPAPDFLPHVTLCHPRRAGAHERPTPGRTWSDLFAANGQAEWGACETTDLVFQRRNEGPGPRYEALASWPLVDV